MPQITRSTLNIHHQDLPDPKSLKLVIYPNAILTKVCQEVAEIDDQIKAYCERLEQVLRSMKNGIGLAACQAGLSLRIYVAFADMDNPDSIAAYINPQFKPDPSAPPLEKQEGCLSLPGLQVDVLRPEAGTLTYLDIHGNKQSEYVTGLKARCAQHEIDHLFGKTLLETMTPASSKKATPFIRRFSRR